ncbi:MAG: ABC transporter permease, partial [Oscillospiraceae bacterium]|nr:ABC transporter permease [Oscillospiraceae bacterium]
MRRKSLSLNLGVVLLAAILLMCIISFLWMPYGPNVMDNENPCSDPSREHLLGTDQYGRDILSRIMVGSRTVLLIGFISVAAGAAAGTLLGSVAAVVKGLPGAVIMRTMEGLMAFPGTLLALMLVAVVGKGQTGAIIAISIYTVAPFARLVYTLILENENLLAIKAARSFGVSKNRLLTHYYMPML